MHPTLLHNAKLNCRLLRSKHLQHQLAPLLPTTNTTLLLTPKTSQNPRSNSNSSSHSPFRTLGLTAPAYRKLGTTSSNPTCAQHAQVEAHPANATGHDGKGAEGQIERTPPPRRLIAIHFAQKSLDDASRGSDGRGYQRLIIAARSRGRTGEAFFVYQAKG